MPEPEFTPTPRYEQVLQAAADLAAQLGHRHVGVEHLFLAIIQDPHAVPTQVLAENAPVADIEDRLREVMSRYPAAPA